MPDIKFNLNYNVKVKLKPEGVKHLRLHATFVSIDDEGYHILQAWELMQIFGPTIVFGSTPMFDTNIIICIP